ncbi:MAG: Stk1 family PASTA domain-containing Ser/Thr kinase [Clostridia bacterium]|nr:Stk1 family PASTA domain-containing Ser/Thr kinase [Clostridia bacterium]
MDNYTGKRLDSRYEIQELIGVGGMAVVYKAYDNIDDRIVAVKILKEEFLANEDFRRRFKNESKAISLLSHPNIVKVYNVNYGETLQYIVMEYVEGITLKEYIEQQGRLGIKETIYFSTQILRALQHAHDKGIIHRDIKPQNILLLSNGTIKISDFGIARFSYSDTKTMTDSAIGSVHYISPEQARGGNIDERTDVYSAGVVMYEMLTGMLPFVSDNSVSVALMQLQNDARSVREINPNIPVGLEQIVKRSMEKNTKNRYQTASEMLLDIEEFKRNPNIRFPETYFVDNEPTRYVEKVNTVNVPARDNTVPVAVDNTAVEEPDYASKGKGGFIITGIIIGLLVVLLAYTGIDFLITGQLFGLIRKSAGDMVEVPDFTGINYQEQIINDPEKYGNFKFAAPNYVADPKFENDIVIAQDPAKRTLINPKKTEITLTVVKNSTTVTVPDVSGKNWEAAKKELENKHFEVQLVPRLTASTPFGEVIETNPKAYTQAPEGSEIQLIYASDEGMITVPTIVGWDVKTAQEKLQSMKLDLDMNFVYKESTEPEGTILFQNPVEGDKVLEGTRIQVTVSEGSKNKEVSIKITLPSRASTLSFEVFVNNEKQESKNVLMDGTNYTFKVSGKEANTPVKVRIDGDDYYTCTVDFSKDNPTISNQSYTQGASIGYSTVPNVTNLPLEEAKNKLKSEGFNNIKVVYETTADATKDGKVTRVNYTQGLIRANYISVNSLITLTVAQADGIATPASTTAAR